MDAQRTLRRPISCAGIGLHSGNKVTLSLKPAPADFGIRFRRTDLGGLEIPATVAHLGGHSATRPGWRANEVLGRDRRAPAGGARQPGHRQRHRRAELARSADHGRQRGAVRLPDPGSGRQAAGGAAPVPEGACGRSRCRSGDKRIALYPSDHFKVTYSISFDHPLLRHQSRTLRITERVVRRGDRAGAHVRVPEGSGDAAAARPGARRLARQRDRARRDRRAEQRAALRGRVRPPQDSRRRSATWRWSATRSSATSWRTAAGTRCTPRSRAKILEEADAWRLVEAPARSDAGAPAGACRCRGEPRSAWRTLTLRESDPTRRTRQAHGPHCCSRRQALSAGR